MRCVYNGTIAQRCQVKSEYEGRMEFLIATIRREDETVTRLKKPLAILAIAGLMLMPMEASGHTG